MKIIDKFRRQKSSQNTGILERFSLLFFDRVKLTLFMWAILLIGGVLSYATFLKREGFPPIQVPIAVVSGTYFVDDASAVDGQIAQPVSSTLASVPEVDTVQTTAGPNFFNAVIFFDDAVESEAGVQVVEAVLADRTDLPEDAQLQVNSIDPSGFLNEYDVLISVYPTEEASLEQLQTEAEEIAQELAQLDGVESTEVREQLVDVENPQTGELSQRQTSFNKIGLRGSDGKLNFYQSVTIGVSKTDALDVIQLSELLSNEATQISSQSDAVEVVITADFADSVSTQIDSLQMNLLGGLLAVALVSFLLITWRASVVTALFMLSVVLLTLLLLWLFGYTLNTITLFGLVLSLGLFVDDATIVVEAIDANRKRKKRSREIVAESVRRVATASFAGTMTTVLVFLPLAFVGGILGEFIRLLPITVIVALLSSLVLSLSLIPFLARYALLRSEAKPRMNPIHTLETYLSNKVESTILSLKNTRTKRKGQLTAVAAVILSLVFIGLSFYYAGKLQFNIFPPSNDSDRIGFQLGFLPGATIEEAQAIADEANRAVRDSIGKHVVRMNYGAFSTPSERSADVQIDLVPFTDRSDSSQEIISELEDELRTTVGGQTASIRVQQFDAGPPTEEFPFKAQIYSEDQDKAVRLAQEMQAVLADAPVVRPNGEPAEVTDTRVEFTQSIVRADGNRFVELQAAFNDDDTSALVEAAQTSLEDRFDENYLDENGYEGVRVGYDFGQESENAESFNSLAIVFPIALGLMFLLLAVQFRSFLQPLLIFLAIPFSLFGVFFGLFTAGIPLSFFVMVGLIGLIGIAVNNSIMLTDYANQERRAGADPIEAIARAARLRFRPLLATTLTTIVALLPLALTDPFWESLSLTIIFGLMSSTFLIIVAFPYYYLGSEWLRGKVRRRRKS